MTSQTSAMRFQRLISLSQNALMSNHHWAPEETPADWEMAGAWLPLTMGLGYPSGSHHGLLH